MVLAPDRTEDALGASLDAAHAASEAAPTPRVTDPLQRLRNDDGSDRADKAKKGKRQRLRRRVLAEPESVESYLRGNSPPRYMQRLRQIETEFGTQCRRLLAAYEALLEALDDDAETFARRWQSRARSWRFDRLNDLVREHNAWYPIEANLPMDPRTRNFIPVRGGSYRRVELGAEWCSSTSRPGRRQRTSDPSSRAGPRASRSRPAPLGLAKRRGRAPCPRRRGRGRSSGESDSGSARLGPGTCFPSSPSRRDARRGRPCA